MLVYGDRYRVATPGRLMEGVRALLEAEPAPAGVIRHAQLVHAFITAGELAQGLADAALEAAGEDDCSPIDDAAMDLVMLLARAVSQSWTSGFQAAAVDTGPAMDRLAALPLPDALRLKQAEGYAFYAVYPETYFEAAAAHRAAGFDHVIGLRSIGTGLAAMVACRAGAGRPITVRPVGHPFRRRVRISSALEARLLRPAGGRYAVVDEGPGLSGSSFGAVGDFLEEHGVAAEQVTYFPSHAGVPGPQASPRHRQRWAASNRSAVGFETLVLNSADPGRGLDRWVADLTGEALEPLTDLSAGRWRGIGSVGSAPVWPQAERRKHLLRSSSGNWLLKFAGLGASDEAKLARAKSLHQAGFTPQPMGLRHGFIVERWIDGARPVNPRQDREALVAHLGDYLGFRAKAFPAPDDAGASIAELMSMADQNLAEVGLEVCRLPHAGRLQGRVRRVFTDNRLQAWEWLRAPDGRLLKTDALDHAEGHDLVGCQDIAWDVAGARAEFNLSEAETEQVCRIIARRAYPVDADLLDVMTTAYLAFQIGYWRLAALSQAGSDAARAEARVATFRAVAAGANPRAIQRFEHQDANWSGR